jgi:hypothetical protein
MKRRLRPKGVYNVGDHPGLEAMPSAALVSLRDEINQEAQVLATRLRYVSTKRDHITSILMSRERPDLTITDHVVVRYMERFRGVDVAALREEIAEQVRRAKNGEGRVCRGKGDAQAYSLDGMTYVVTYDRAVVTMYPEQEDQPLST